MIILRLYADMLIVEGWVDTEEQKKKLRDDPKAYLEYRKMVEAEIGIRFRFLMKNGPEAKTAREVSVLH